MKSPDYISVLRRPPRAVFSVAACMHAQFWQASQIEYVHMADVNKRERLWASTTLIPTVQYISSCNYGLVSEIFVLLSVL
jgi:hypothetical protein